MCETVSACLEEGIYSYVQQGEMRIAANAWIDAIKKGHEKKGNDRHDKKEGARSEVDGSQVERYPQSSGFSSFMISWNTRFESTDRGGSKSFAVFESSRDLICLSRSSL